MHASLNKNKATLAIVERSSIIDPFVHSYQNELFFFPYDINHITLIADKAKELTSQCHISGVGGNEIFKQGKYEVPENYTPYLSMMDMRDSIKKYRKILSNESISMVNSTSLYDSFVPYYSELSPSLISKK
jgi:hypothetical protein